MLDSSIALIAMRLCHYVGLQGRRWGALEGTIWCGYEQLYKTA
jgi:hypothetical protein